MMSRRNQGWFKSSYSNGTAYCVSLQFVDGEAYVRDDKQFDGPVLVFNRGEWEAFLLGVLNGEFEMPE